MPRLGSRARLKSPQRRGSGASATPPRARHTRAPPPRPPGPDRWPEPLNRSPLAMPVRHKSRPRPVQKGSSSRSRARASIERLREPTPRRHRRNKEQSKRTENIRLQNSGGGPPTPPSLGRYISSELGPFRSFVSAPCSIPLTFRVSRPMIWPTWGRVREFPSSNPSRNRKTSLSELSNDRFIAISMASRSSWKAADE